MYDSNKLVSERVLRKLLEILPSPKQKQMGRKRCQKKALIGGILQVLINGCAWGKIAECGCSYVSSFRYFQELQRRGKLKLIHKEISKEKTDISEGSIDTTTVSSFEFRYQTGWDGHNKKVGTKVSVFADKNGLPADVDFAKGNVDDKDILPQHLKNTVGRRKRLVSLDMKYMSLSLRRVLRGRGIRINMKVRDQDYTRKRGPKFRFDEEIYKRRFLLERTNGWIKAFRSLVLRRSYHIASFKALVYLAVIIILLRS
jgi:transposase